MKESRNNAVLVVGGGIAGAQVASELILSGVTVYLAEKAPSLGGITSQLGYMFPHHNCVLCRGTGDHGFGCTRPSISPAFLDFNQSDQLHVLTLSELVELQGQPGQFTATVLAQPRYVDPALCINCDKCAEVCPIEITDRYSPVPTVHKAAYKPDCRAIPNSYIIDKGNYCTDCNKCQEVCPTRAIDLSQTAQTIRIEVGAVVLATGYQLHNPAASVELGYGSVPNVLTGLEFERLASLGGPSEGRIVRPSDGQPPRRIAWLQCVGSRDKEHDYCSTFCCMYATKQAVLAKQNLPEAECTIFFMDDRVFAKQFLDTYETMRRNHGIQYTRCRLFDVRKNSASGEIVFRYLADGSSLQEARFDLLVLSVGAEPTPELAKLADTLGIELNAHGFVKTAEIIPGVTSREGIFACGSNTAPKDICDATTEATGVASQVVAFLRESLTQPQNQATASAPSAVQVEEPRIGVFICRCADEIGGVIDVDALADYALCQPNVVHAQIVEFGCLAEGQREIERAIEAHDVNRIVAGACTPRTHRALFERILSRTDNDAQLLEFVGLREFCTWPHRDHPAEAARKAHELLRRAIARVEMLEPIPQDEIVTHPETLVIGGGLAGLMAALHLADRGIPVHLVEKSAQLGGNFARIRYLPGGSLPGPVLSALIERVENHDKIIVHRLTEVVRSSGRLGNFQSVLHKQLNGQKPSEETVTHGAVLVASGANEYRGNVYLLNEAPQVLTQLDLEEELSATPEQVSSWHSVVMINCVGPWNAGDAQPWRCSRNCCLQVMKNALRIKTLNPSCQVVVLYRETMTTAFFEELYTEARRQGVLFVRYDPASPPAVELEGEQLVVRLKDLSLGQMIELHPHRLALAVALVPNPDNRRLAKLLNVDLLASGFFEETEPKQRGTESHRAGVFLCGLAHGPKTSQLNIAQALNAAEKVARLLSPGVIYPERVVAVVDETHCMACLTCVRTCPYGVPTIDPQREGKGGIMGASYIDPLNCQGCGVCTSECPGKAIALNFYRDEQVMVALGSWEV